MEELTKNDFLVNEEEIEEGAVDSEEKDEKEDEEEITDIYDE